MSSAKKLQSITELKKIVAQKKKQGKKIVFTNGCFDLLHYGHIYCINKAKKYGDILIVGINSDVSIRKIKGHGRPVIEGKLRATLLSLLRSIDYMVFFDSRTPLSVIKALCPDVLVKGGDYRVDEVVGKNEVLASGGRVVIIKRIPGFSTSGILMSVGKNG